MISGGEALVRLLESRGVDCLFGTPGSEFGPIMEAFAEPRAVRPVLAPHEFCGVSMAHGHYLGSGRTQAVLVHVTVGTAMASGALLNAARMDVPVLFMAGRSSVTEEARDRFVHWGQEAFDQGGPVREYTRWESEVRHPSTLEPLLDRALAVAASPPAGPVHLMIPREILTGAVPEPGPCTQAPASPPAPDARSLEEVRRLLRASALPVVVTSRFRRPDLLREVAERLGLGVITPQPQYACFPAGHPHHLAVEALAQADLVITLDEDVPWMGAPPRADARVVQVGADPHFRALPLRTHRSDLCVTADPALFLEALRPEDAARPGRLGLAPRPAASAHPVTRALAEAWQPDWTLFNELSLPPEGLPLTTADAYFRSGTGSCLGWGLPASLGYKLARPERTVLAVLGDGAYFYANPLACHQVARAQGLPTLTLVLDNGTAASVRSTAPPGGRARALGRYAFADFGPMPDFAAVMRACGGHGQAVHEPDDLPAALARGLAAVRQGRPALLDLQGPLAAG